ncbi:hypothetical protein [Lacisediminihabitans sp. H27-G8]|uniref:hypothetical protein n=1 Tax=Lacisediminihabitans sp. H27-G8 TaxID=3111909 RepID=UPI0038FC4990
MARDTLVPRKPLLLRVIYWVAALEAVLGTLFTLLSAGVDLFAQTVAVAMPVQSFWPDLKPSVRLDPAPLARVTGGGFEMANVSLTGIGLDARIWLAAAQLFQGTMAVAIGVAVAVLAARLLRGDPFGRVLSKTAFGTATTIGVGGILWQVCSGVGGLLVSAQVLRVTGWSIDNRDLAHDTLNEIGWPLPAQGLSIEFWPIGAALAIVAIGIAFRYGETLQADAERLRRQKLALQRDTEGLI